MATATQLPAPRSVFFDANGDLLAGGFVHTYVAGGGTTPKATYQDAAETIPNSQPIVLDTAGSCLLYGSGSYTLAVTDASGNAIAGYSGTTLGLLPLDTDEINYTVPSTGGVARTLTAKLGDRASVKDFGAKGDGVADDSAAIAAAITAMAGGGEVFFPPGTYRMVSPQTIAANTTLSGVRGASIIRGATANMTMFSYSAGGLTANSGGFLNLTFDGGADSITAISATLAYGMMVSGCLFTGVRYAVKVERCWAPTISDCIIRGNASRAAGAISLTNTTGGGNGLSALGYISNVLHDCSAASGTAGAQVSPLVLISETENMQLTSVVGLGLDVVAPGTVTHIEILGLCQGIGLSQCSSVGASTGIQLQAAATGVAAPSFITISGCQIDSFYSTGISVIGTATGAVNIVEINGGSITAPKVNAAVCINLVHIGLAVKIIGVDFYQWFNYPTKSGIGIALTSANYVTISACFFSQLSTAIIFQASSSLRNLVSNCTFLANTTTISGSAGVGNQIVGNNSDLSLATLSASLTLPALPASGATYVNDTGYTLVVSIGGGTVTAISTLAGTAPLTQGQFVLPPGNTAYIVVTYAVAPTWAIGVLSA